MKAPTTLELIWEHDLVLKGRSGDASIVLDSAGFAGPSPVRAAAPPGGPTYLEVLRGVAVLIMIEAHVLDSWTRAAARRSRAFGESLILGGFGAPLFLFLAGIAVAMSAGSKARRTGDTRGAVRAVQRRGLEIFLLAFVFRFQSFVLSHSPAWALLK